MTTKIHVLSARITGSIGSFVKSMDKARNATQRMRQSWVTAAGSISAAGSRIGLAAGLVGGIVVKKFADFEDQITRVGAVTETLGKEQFQTLKDAALEAGETTSFTATQSAEAIEKLGLAGLSVEEITGGALTGALQLATAAQIDIATAADIAAKQMRAFGLAASDLSRINDTLVATQARSNINILQLAEALKPVAPLAAQQNVSLEKTAAILAKMADSGFQGSVAGVALRRAFINLSGPTKQTADALERFGIEAGDTLFEKLRKIKMAIDEAGTETEQLKIATEIFGARAAAPMVAALKVGVDELEKFANGLEDAGGIAARIEQTQLNTLTGQFAILNSQIEGVILSIGDGLNPTLRGSITNLQDFITAHKPEIVEQFRNVLGAVIKTFRAVSQFALENADALLRVASAIGRAIAGIGQFLAENAKLVAALAALKTASLLGVTQAVTALATAITTTLITAIRALRVAFIAMGASSKAAWASATLGVSLLIAAITSLILNFDKIKKFFSETSIFDGLKESFSEIKEVVVKELFPALKELGLVLKDLLVPIFKFLLDFVVIPLAKDAIRRLTFGIKLLTGAFKVVAAVLEGVIDGFKLVGTVFKNVFSNMGKIAKATFTGIADGFKAALSGDFSGVRKAFADTLNKVSTIAFQDIASEVFGDEFEKRVKDIEEKAKDEAKDRAPGPEEPPAAAPGPQPPPPVKIPGGGTPAVPEEGSGPTEGQREAMEQAIRGGLELADRIKKLGEEGKIAAEKARSLEFAIQSAFDRLKNGTLSAEDFGIVMDSVAEKTDEAIEAQKKKIAQEQFEMKQSILMARLKGKELDEEQKAFLQERVKSRKQERETNLVTSAFDRLVDTMSGARKAVEKAGNGFREFGEQAKETGGAVQRNMPSQEQVSKLHKQLAQFFSSRTGLIANARNQIALLQQTLTILDDNIRRRRVIDKIESLIDQIKRLEAAKPEPLFSGISGQFSLPDPGLQINQGVGRSGPGSMSINLPNVKKLSEVTREDARQIVDMIELEFQQRGRRL